ncbi:TPA: glycosyltransferase family 9 protein [bacterium]|nr:glycosyltransferase family 9 protein [bacterium]
MDSPYNIERILIIRTDGIGDVLNSTPAISALRQTYQNAHISIVVKPHGAEILSNNPDIDEIIVYNPKTDDKGLIGKIKFLKRLGLGNYDATIVLHNSSMGNLMAYASRAKIRIGRKSESKGFSNTLTHWVNNHDPKGTKHEIDRNIDIVNLLNVKSVSKQLKFYLTDGEKEYAERFLHDHAFADEKKAENPIFHLVGMHPGGSSYDKLWTPDGFIEIADRLVGEFNARIMLFGGPNEVKLVQNITDNITYPIITAFGVSLRQFASLLNRCSLFICNDSGPMHIASALNIPTIAIFGPTDYVRWRPNNKKSLVVRKEMDCWPCSAHKCKKNYECTKTLPVSQVWDAIIKLSTDDSVCML